MWRRILDGPGFVWKIDKLSFTPRRLSFISLLFSFFYSLLICFCCVCHKIKNNFSKGYLILLIPKESKFELCVFYLFLSSIILQMDEILHKVLLRIFFIVFCLVVSLMWILLIFVPRFMFTAFFMEGIVVFIACNCNFSMLNSIDSQFYDFLDAIRQCRFLLLFISIYFFIHDNLLRNNSNFPHCSYP